MALIQNGVLNRSKMFFYSNSTNDELFYYPLSVGHFYCSNDYRVERNSFNSFLITYIVRGSFSFIVDGKELTANSGEIAIIDCYNKHLYYTNDSFEAYWVHIGGSNSKKLFQKLIDDYGNVIKYDDDTNEIKEIYSLIKTKSIYNIENISFLIYRLICKLFNANKNEVSKNDAISTAIAFINSNYSSITNVEEIANAVNLSVSQFSRRFKRQTGASPYDYILSIRLTKSKELLKSSSLSISEIADKTGFNSYSNFIYFFTSREGISPLKFRNTLF